MGHIGLQPESQLVLEAKFATPPYRSDNPDADCIIGDGKGGR